MLFFKELVRIFKELEGTGNPVIGIQQKNQPGIQAPVSP
ncbi:hypothetical protein KNP414_01703 [Paenibacillus mucilaginosus KNP414]|uniref:Uncharacterized protein n=1 Tax=Paenibacillus mucilaginosus (strain KNP414) TaxID=1036673 RepID=F8FQ45_PAEMK|nr:hypothetical protein KNP414_01703 [Paenibacillus mucilaginosus KNP414]